MAEGLSGEFGDSAQGPSARELAARQDIVTIYRNSWSDGVWGIGDKSAPMTKEQMEGLYKHFGSAGQVRVETGDARNPHDFQVRIKDHGKGEYSLALYENGKHAGTGKTDGVDLTPNQIYEQNPLQPPQPVAAQVIKPF